MRSASRLGLYRETIRRLTADDLLLAAGGTGSVAGCVNSQGVQCPTGSPTCAVCDTDPPRSDP